MSKSLFGSVKDKFKRSSAGPEKRSPSLERSSRSTTPSSAPTAPMGRSNPFSTTAPAPQSNPADDPPPAYSAAPPPAGASPSPSLASVTNDDDRYAFLASFDTVFVVDDSGSMAGACWREVDAALRAITPICTARDRDGVDLYFLNHRSATSPADGRAPGGYYNITDARAVEAVFRDVRPRSTTPTGTRLESILKPYVEALARGGPDAVRPVNLIVITDGCPTDDPEGVIVQHARRLDQLNAPAYQVGIQFFQVGWDPAAREALAELDDELSAQGVRDMVDTVTWDGTAGAARRALTADGILKVVLGAVVRRLDRRATGGDRRSRT